MITIAPRLIFLGLAIAWAFGALLGSWGQMFRDGNTALLPQVFAFVAGFILCAAIGALMVVKGVVDELDEEDRTS